MLGIFNQIVKRTTQCGTKTVMNLMKNQRCGQTKVFTIVRHFQKMTPIEVTQLPVAIRAFTDIEVFVNDKESYSACVKSLAPVAETFLISEKLPEQKKTLKIFFDSLCHFVQRINQNFSNFRPSDVVYVIYCASQLMCLTKQETVNFLNRLDKELDILKLEIQDCYFLARVMKYSSIRQDSLTIKLTKAVSEQIKDTDFGDADCVDVITLLCNLGAYEETKQLLVQFSQVKANMHTKLKPSELHRLLEAYFIQGLDCKKPDENDPNGGKNYFEPITVSANEIGKRLIEMTKRPIEPLNAIAFEDSLRLLRLLECSVARDLSIAIIESRHFNIAKEEYFKKRIEYIRSDPLSALMNEHDKVVEKLAELKKNISKLNNNIVSIDKE